MTRRGALLLAASLAASTVEVAAEEPPAYRVTSRTTPPENGVVGFSPASEAAGRLYYTGTGPTGPGLYVRDAGSHGSVLLAGVSAGPVVELDGRGYFIDLTGGTDGLWTTDGTPGGTRLVKVISNLQFDVLTRAGSLLYFFGPRDSLWRSDGTAAGTFELQAGGTPGELLAVGGSLYFLATDPVSHRLELRKTSVGGDDTVRIADLGQGVSRWANGLALAGGRLVFFTREDQGFRMWASDGTEAGTTPLRDFSRDFNYLCPDCLTPGPSRPVSNGEFALFFANDGVHGREPWRTDGTAAGTRLVRDIAPGSASSDTVEDSESFGDGSPAVGDVQLFEADDGVHGSELWMTDGTEAGTSLVSDLVPGPGGSSVRSFATAGGFFFFCTDGRLWRSDGTAAGTQAFGGLSGCPSPLGSDVSIVASNGLWRSDGTSLDLIDGGALPLGFSPWQLTAAAGTIFFMDTERTLWTTDGSDGGTRQLGGFGGVGDLQPTGRQVFFTPDQGPSSNVPWMSDGTEQGTRPLSGFVGDLATDFTGVGGRVFYTATDEAHGNELWTIDGADTPRLVADLAPGPSSSSPSRLTAFGRALFFRRDDEAGVWRTDGTEVGTSRILAAQRVDWMVAGSDRLWIVGDDGVSPVLWVSDGTAAGTVQAASLPGSISQETPSGRRLFYSVDDLDRSELWTSDGTSQGTEIVGSFAFIYSIAAAAEGAVFFTADDGLHGAELWRSDGTSAGTALVADILPGVFGSLPLSMLSVDGLLLFSADDGVHGRELWRSDGTAEGTFMLQDIMPGLLSSSPDELTRAGNIVYFRATDDTGAQLWALPLETSRAAVPSPRGPQPRTAPPRD